jgi:hypothetical protein
MLSYRCVRQAWTYTKANCKRDEKTKKYCTDEKVRTLTGKDAIKYIEVRYDFQRSSYLLMVVFVQLVQAVSRAFAEEL